MNTTIIATDPRRRMASPRAHRPLLPLTLMKLCVGPPRAHAMFQLSPLPVNRRPSTRCTRFLLSTRACRPAANPFTTPICPRSCLHSRKRDCSRKVMALDASSWMATPIAMASPFLSSCRSPMEAICIRLRTSRPCAIVQKSKAPIGYSTSPMPGKPSTLSRYGRVLELSPRVVLD